MCETLYAGGAYGRRPLVLTPACRMCHRLPTLRLVTAIAVVLSRLCSACPATERVRVTDANVAEIEIKDCLQIAAAAISDEDLDAFIGCFVATQRPRLRRKAAILFVRCEVDIELMDNYLVDAGDQNAEMAVMYRMTLSQRSCDVVSLLTLQREDGAWRIAAERVQAVTPILHPGSVADSADQAFGGVDGVLIPPDQREKGLPNGGGVFPGNGCANGRCGFAR